MKLKAGSLRVDKVDKTSLAKEKMTEETDNQN